MAIGCERGAPVPVRRPSAISMTRLSRGASATSWVAIRQLAPALAGRAAERLEHPPFRDGVLMPGGLVGEHERRREHERAGDGGPLLLAERGLLRVPRGEVRDREIVHQLVDAVAQLIEATGQSCRVLDVLPDGELIEQPELLRHDGQLVPPWTAPARSERSIVPLSGRSHPAITFSKVVLPEPERPTRPTSSPARSVSSTSFSAWMISSPRR